MTSGDVKQAILDIISELVPDEDLSALDDTVRIRDQIDLDSMDFLDIIMELRKRYNIQVPESDYPQFATMNGCVNYLTPRLASK